MSTRRRKLIFGFATSTALSSVASVVAAVLVACGADDDKSGPPGLGLPDAGTDAINSSPEASPPDDGGADLDAQTVRDPFDAADEPVTCTGTAPCAKQITSGRNHFCALMSDGTVRCWGANDRGALGGGSSPPDPPAPHVPDAGSETTLVAGLTNVVQLSAGGNTTCARRDDGSVHCWGDNGQGQLGLDDVEPRWDEDSHPTPEPAALQAPAVRVDVGPSDVCAVMATGKVSCWGNNEMSQLARPDLPTEYVLGPALAVLEPFAIARTTIGTTTLLGLTTGGEIVSWGDVGGRSGLLSGRLTSISPDPAPKPILDLKNVSSLVGTASRQRPGSGVRIAHACAIADGDVYCWGRNDVGALGTGLPDALLLPTRAPIKGKAWPQQLAVGDDITCARMTDGSVQCCGANESGRLGSDNTETFSMFFEPIASFKGHAVQVATSDHAVCALEKDGTVGCWGGNASGELATGTSDEDSHPSPVKIAF